MCYLFVFFVMIPPPPRSTLFPYTTLFRSLGDSPEKASQEATVVMNIETALAKGSMDRVDRRDPEKIYHKISEQERSEEHTSELQSRRDLVCRLLLEKKKIK